MTEPRNSPGIHAGWSRPAAAGRLRRGRVEHRHGGATTVLARGVEALPLPGELVPFVSRLRRDGLAGDIVLVDEASGAELTRAAVRGRAGRRPPARPFLAGD